MDSMREDGCSQEFITAVNTLGRCLATDPEYWAEKLHAALSPNSAEFITLLLERSEVIFFFIFLFTLKINVMIIISMIVNCFFRLDRLTFRL